MGRWGKVSPSHARLAYMHPIAYFHIVADFTLVCAPETGWLPGSQSTDEVVGYRRLGSICLLI